MKKKLQQQPWFLILIPLFFVLHGYTENLGFITINASFLLLLTYYAVAILLYFIFWFIFKNSTKAALAASTVQVFNLFFGAIQDFLRDHLTPAVSRYRVLVSAFIILLICLLIYLKKTKKHLLQLSFFLNVLLLIYILVDLTLAIKRSISPPANKFSVYAVGNKDMYKPVTDVKRPDIYFLLFDEYASSLSLKEQYQFNNDLDSFLLQTGFHIQQKSYSNYNYTPVSMASLLNMSYIKEIHDNTLLLGNDIGYCNRLIQNNEVIKFLTHQGYDIVNYSTFDLTGRPASLKESILPLEARLISDNTFSGRVVKDFTWAIFLAKYKLSWLFPKPEKYRVVKNNKTAIHLVQQEIRKQSTVPRFIYAHIYMPHDPFFFDKNGHLNDDVTAFQLNTKYRSARVYLDYLTYTNQEIKKLITDIQLNTKGNAVIILMGDHGFREYIDQDLHQNYQNMNAVYFPEKNYRLFYDSISCVNQFRVIFNSLFHQSLPLLEDSTVFLTGKE